VERKKQVKREREAEQRMCASGPGANPLCLRPLSLFWNWKKEKMFSPSPMDSTAQYGEGEERAGRKKEVSVSGGLTPTKQGEHQLWPLHSTKYGPQSGDAVSVAPNMAPFVYLRLGTIDAITDTGCCSSCLWVWLLLSWGQTGKGWGEFAWVTTKRLESSAAHRAKERLSISVSSFVLKLSPQGSL
jgi:hypothetical protein